MPDPDWLSPDDARFIVKGLSITLASRDLRLVPSVARGLACRLSDDAAQLIVLLCRSQSETLLADVSASGHVAVVITEPSSHRTLQFKGSDAIVASAEKDDLATVDASRRHFGEDILPLGFAAQFNDRLFYFEPDDLCRLVFTPSDVFEQTPGPDAGTRIGPNP